MHVQPGFFDHRLQGKAHELILGIAERLGELECSRQAHALAAMLDVAQVRTRDAELASERSLTDFVTETNRLERATERAGPSRCARSGWPFLLRACAEPGPSPSPKTRSPGRGSGLRLRARISPKSKKPAA